MAWQMGYTPCWLYTSSLMCSPFISLKYAAENYHSVETHTQFSQKSHQGWKEVLIISTLNLAAQTILRYLDDQPSHG